LTVVAVLNPSLSAFARIPPGAPAAGRG